MRNNDLLKEFHDAEEYDPPAQMLILSYCFPWRQLLKLEWKLFVMGLFSTEVKEEGVEKWLEFKEEIRQVALFGRMLRRMEMRPEHVALSINKARAELDAK